MWIFKQKKCDMIWVKTKRDARPSSIQLAVAHSLILRQLNKELNENNRWVKRVKIIQIERQRIEYWEGGLFF